MIPPISRAARAAALVLIAVLSGCATQPADKGVDTPDPLEPLNRTFFAINDALDKAILGPVSRAYVKVTPEAARTGVNNFFTNLGYPYVFVNQFLQGKIETGFEDVERFVINSTFGLGGLVDFAGAIGFAQHEEDLGQTLAVWGVGPGVYLEVPLFGPSTLRDAATIPARMVSDPLFYADVVVSLPAGALETVDMRSRLESAIKLRDETALDPYVFQRQAWLQRRRNQIFDGEPPLEPLEPFEPLDGPDPPQ